jgi:nucleotide-binding universal stress UspA family protein
MKIVVGYLRSQEGLAALDIAATAAKGLDAELVVVHSYEEDENGSSTYELELEEVSNRLEAEGVAHTTRALSRGLSPAADIIRVARELEAGLIVVGLRSRSPVGKALLGSVTQTVLFDAPCPVLTVKGDGAKNWAAPRIGAADSTEEHRTPGHLEVDPRDAPPTG